MPTKIERERVCVYVWFLFVFYLPEKKMTCFINLILPCHYFVHSCSSNFISLVDLLHGQICGFNSLSSSLVCNALPGVVSTCLKLYSEDIQ